jgi:universal stress protein A
MTVIEPMGTPDLGAFPLMAEDRAGSQRARRRLQTVAGKFEDEIPMTTIVRAGQPFEQIATAAREVEADLIIIATRGLTGLKHTLLGSTAERVVRHAPCPVLTVRRCAEAS